MSEHAKKLCEIINKTNEEESSSQLYSFRAFVTPEDLKGLRQLNQLLGQDFEFEKSDTEQFMKFLLGLNIENPP